MLKPSPPSPFSSSMFWISNSHMAKGDPMASSVTLSCAAALSAGSPPASAPLGSACFCREREPEVRTEQRPPPAPLPAQRQLRCLGADERRPNIGGITGFLKLRGRSPPDTQKPAFPGLKFKHARKPGALPLGSRPRAAAAPARRRPACEGRAYSRSCARRQEAPSGSSPPPCGSRQSERCR